MHVLLRVILLLTGLSLVPLPNLRLPNQVQLKALSQLERRQAGLASQLAVRSPLAALRWLRGRSDVRQAALGLDRQTIEVRFKDGADLAILPRTTQLVRALAPVVPQGYASSPAADPSSNRAIVLEPFANQVGLGETAGQAQIDSLTRAGFQVDVLRNSAVTVASLANLADYGMVYVESHSGVLPSGDAILVVDETSLGPYLSLYGDGSVQQAVIGGDPSGTPYDAINSKFVLYHMGTFPSHSIVYLNGCSILGAPVFWQALHSKGVATLISWDHEVYSTVNDPSSQFVLSLMAQGDTVAHSVLEAGQQGLGESVVDGVAAHLGFLGDGNDSLAQLRGAPLPQPSDTPTSTPTPMPTPTSTATPTLTPTASATPTVTPRPRAQAERKTARTRARAVKTPRPRSRAVSKPSPRKRAVRCKRGWRLVHGKCQRVRPPPKCKRPHCK